MDVDVIKYVDSRKFDTREMEIDLSNFSGWLCLWGRERVGRKVESKTVKIQILGIRFLKHSESEPISFVYNEMFRGAVTSISWGGILGDDPVWFIFKFRWVFSFQIG